MIAKIIGVSPRAVQRISEVNRLLPAIKVQVMTASHLGAGRTDMRNIMLGLAVLGGVLSAHPDRVSAQEIACSRCNMAATGAAANGGVNNGDRRNGAAAASGRSDAVGSIVTFLRRTEDTEP